MKNTVCTFSKKMGRKVQYISYVVIIFCMAALVSLTATTVFAVDTPIAINSDEAGMKALTGKWIGEYSSKDNTRYGYLSLSLAGQKEKAIGEITMISKSSEAESQTQSPSKDVSKEALTITFVEAAQNKISGTVVPFFNPQYNSIVHTVFLGMRHDGDVLEGTFTSTIEKTGGIYTGIWKVIYAGPAN